MNSRLICHPVLTAAVKNGQFYSERPFQKRATPQKPYTALNLGQADLERVVWPRQDSLLRHARQRGYSRMVDGQPMSVEPEFG